MKPTEVEACDDCNEDRKLEWTSFVAKDGNHMRRDSDDVMLLCDHRGHSKKSEEDNELPFVAVVHMLSDVPNIGLDVAQLEHVERQFERVDSAVARHIKVHNPMLQCNQYQGVGGLSILAEGH